MKSDFFRDLSQTLFISLCIFLSACGGGGAADSDLEDAIVTGRVSESGLGLEDIIIVDLVSGSETHTAEDGRFSLDVQTTVTDEIGILVDNFIISLGELPAGAAGFRVELERDDNRIVLSERSVIP